MIVLHSMLRSRFSQWLHQALWEEMGGDEGVCDDRERDRGAKIRQDNRLYRLHKNNKGREEGKAIDIHTGLGNSCFRMFRCSSVMAGCEGDPPLATA